MTAVAAAPTTAHNLLRAGQVQPLLTEALARWQAAGVDPSAPHGIDVRIADLGGQTTARADGGVIWLADDVAGRVWFVDRTPQTDPDFTRRGNQGEVNRVDLSTVLGHKIGRLLGYDRGEGGAMAETLAADERFTIGGTDADDRAWFLAPTGVDESVGASPNRRKSQ